MDIFDQAQERIEQEESLRRAAFKPVEIPKGTGECWLEGCDEVPPNEGRWCCPEHRTLWEKEGGVPKQKAI